jgi:hypothetical protein
VLLLGSMVQQHNSSRGGGFFKENHTTSAHLVIIKMLLYFEIPIGHHPSKWPCRVKPQLQSQAHHSLFRAEDPSLFVWLVADAGLC